MNSRVVALLAAAMAAVLFAGNYTSSPILF
jgi:hypothetical protein